jgi:membrane protein
MTEPRADQMNEAISDAEMEHGRGRRATAPGQIPLKGWKDVLWRTASEIVEDRVTLIAAGVTYYLLLASFPALGVLVSLYGFVSDPADIGKQIGFLSMILPPGALDLVLGQLSTLSSQKASTLSAAFIISFAVALWSANSGVKALFDAMNVAYGEEEKRSFVQLNLLSLGFTLGALVVAVVLIIAVGIVPAALALLRLDGWAEALAAIARWPLVLVVVWAATMVIYRYGPSRDKAKLRWLSWGAGISALIWMAASIAFSFYLQNFGHYNVTYGTLGALIGFMVWTWISVVILIMGAELDAELEHQTLSDSTTGPPAPIGQRGAVMADTVGRASE